LHLAANERHTSIVEILLKKGAKTETKTEDGETCLHFAARLGFTDVAALLLDNGADSEAVMSDGRRAIHLTAQTGWLEVAQVLLQKKAQPNSVEGNGQTALHYAAYYGWENMVNLLLHGGARADAKTSKGSTAYDIAERMGHHDVVATLAAADGGQALFKNERKVHNEFVAPGGTDAMQRSTLQRLAGGKTESDFGSQMYSAAGTPGAPPVTQIAGSSMMVKQKTRVEAVGSIGGKEKKGKVKGVMAA
jgi:ankyrin repeat protein